MTLLLLAACGGLVCGEDEVRRDATCQPYVPGSPVPSTASSVPVGTTWQWQITGTVDTSVEVGLYDLDLFQLTEPVRDTLRADGRTLICYFSAGSFEPWTADADAFPEEAIGRRLEGWPDERWLDITRSDVRALLAARLDLAVERGCDGVEPDNVTAWDTSSGFGITPLEQLEFNRWLADEAHSRGLSIALKNDVEQVPALVDWFDFTVNEECFAFDECATLQPFLDADKAVLNAEYVDDFEDAPALADQICPVHPGFSTIVKEWDLGPKRVACP